MKLNWQHIEAFHAVMTSGSTVTASAILGCSQPTVSRLIQRLEDMSRIRLFHHNGSRLVPTEEAEALFAEIGPSFPTLDRIQRAIADVRMMKDTSLRIATMPALALDVIPRALSALRSRFPNVRAVMQVRDSLTVRELVRSGACDIGYPFDGFSRTGVKSDLIGTRSGVLVYNPDVFSIPDVVDNFKCLDGVPFIVYPREDVIRRQVEQRFETAKAELNVVCEVAYAHNICALVARGLGVGIISPFGVMRINDAPLATARLKRPIDFKYYSIQRIGWRPSTAVTYFISEMRRQLAN